MIGKNLEALELNCKEQHELVTHILLHHWNSPSCLWADAPSPGIVIESCSHGDCGLVFQITLYWKEAGIPWRITVLDLEVGRQWCFQRCLWENWNVHRGQLKENLLYPHQGRWHACNFSTVYREMWIKSHGQRFTHCGQQPDLQSTFLLTCSNGLLKGWECM